MIARKCAWIPLLTAGLLATVQNHHGQDVGPRLVDTGSRIVAAAREQIGVTLEYDSSYVVLDYPMGDVPEAKGVCSDVVIRALRRLGIDLQELVHLDMKRNFGAYPKIWGLRRPDRNIDHRRVQNLRTFLSRCGFSRTVSDQDGDYLPGDLVTCTVPPALPHIVVVSDRRTNGRPWIIHNIGSGAVEEDRLFEFPITGHYRISLERLQPTANPQVQNDARHVDMHGRD